MSTQPKCICARKVYTPGDTSNKPPSIWVADVACSICNTYYIINQTTEYPPISHKPYAFDLVIPNVTRPVFLFHKRDTILIWDMVMPLVTAIKKRGGLEWLIDYLNRERHTEWGRRHNTAISHVIQTASLYVTQIITAHRMHGAINYHACLSANLTHSRNLANFEKKRSEFRHSCRHDIFRQALVDTIPPPIIDIIGGLLGYIAPTGDELVEEIRHATITRIDHTLMVVGIPQTLIHLIINYIIT
jgi:hypothetical protein